MINKTIIGTAFNSQVRFIICDTKELVQHMHDINGTSKTAICALGRSATITAMMGLQLKDDQKISTIIKGNGPLGQIICDANAKGEVKGLVINPYVDIPLNDKQKVDVAKGVGTEGTLKVIKDLNLKDPFIGEVNIVSGEIAEDFTYYYSASEQIPTAISAGVLIDTDYSIKSSGGLIVQIMPDSDDEIIDMLESIVLNLKPMTTLLLENSLEDILQSMFGEDYKILERANIEFKCTCEKERFINSIKMLSKEDIEEIKEDKEIEVKCDFCQKVYKINTDLL